MSRPPSLHLLDASDALNRADCILGYVLSKRAPDDDQGESWTLGVVEDAINEAKRLIDAAQEGLKTPEADADDDADIKHIDRIIAESMAINTMKAAIAAHEARLAGGAK